jgi:hypothetical protein
MLTATVSYPGSAGATITATETTNGVKFSIAVSGDGDIRGLFLDVGGNPISPPGTDSDGTNGFNWYNGYAITGNDVTDVAWGENAVIDLGGGANMQGQEPSNAPVEGYRNDIFDLGVEIGTQGADPDYIQNTEFTVDGITLADLKDQFFGLRLTSTTGTAGSLKLVGKFTDGNTDDDWEGLSPGYWKNWSPQPPGNQVNDWNEDPIIFANGSYKTFESIFNVNPGMWLVSPTVGARDDVTMLEALQLGADIKGQLKKNALARQATAALLNTYEKDDTDPNGAVNYRFTTQNVLDWTGDALSADWQSVASSVSGFTDTSTWTSQQATVFGLADLFAQNNNLGLYT